MTRYVLKYRGSDPLQADADPVEHLDEVTVLDRSPGALLVEASEQATRRLQGQLPPGWLVAEEVVYPAPGPARERVRDDSEDR